jgi:hypothetical protein
MPFELMALDSAYKPQILQDKIQAIMMIKYPKTTHLRGCQDTYCISSFDVYTLLGLCYSKRIKESLFSPRPKYYILSGNE